MNINTFFKKSCSLYLLLHLVAMAVVAVLLLVCVKFGLNLYTHHGECIDVPNLVGKQYEDAFRILDSKGLVLEVSDSGYNKKMPANTVLAQYPGDNDKVKQGHVIYVTLNSSHSPLLTIPDVVDNSSFREAQAKLTSMGFKLLTPQMVHGEKDWVYGIVSRGRKVYAGDRIPVDNALILQVGDGSFDEGSMDVDYVAPTPRPVEEETEPSEEEYYPAPAETKNGEMPAQMAPVERGPLPDISADEKMNSKP